MKPELLKGFYRIGIFVVGTSVALLFIVKPDSAEFFITLLSICVGATLPLLVGMATWYINR